MSIKETLITALENELNKRGFSEVYEKFVECETCPMLNMCSVNTVEGMERRETCTEYIERLMKEDTSNADRD